MADYTSIVSVRSYLPAGNRVDELTKPSLTEVLAWIAQSTGMANAALAQGNAVVPVVDPDTLIALDPLCGHWVVYQYFSARGVTIDKNNPPTWADWDKQFQDALALMRKGDWTAAVTDDGGPESYTMNAEDDDTDDSLDPVFTRDRKF